MKKGKQNRKTKSIISSLIMSVIILITGVMAINPFNLRDIIANRLKVNANGDVPAHTKSISDNHDGTWKLSLDVTGDSEKKTQKVNVIVIVDRSGSMNYDSGTTTTTYTATTSTGGNNYNNNNPSLYGLVNGQYVPLTRTSTTSGPWWNQTTTYHFWYNGTEYTGQRYTRQTSGTRMQATKAAVNSLAENLLANNEVEGNPNDTVEMALVTFGTTATTNISKTNLSSTFTNAVSNINVATGNDAGTNWEDALEEANGINFEDSDPTYIIFFSDGAPTFRNTQAGYNDRFSSGIYGTGQEEEPNMERAYTQATDNAAALATKVGKSNFYTIFAYGGDEGKAYMTSLTTASGAPAGNNYSASNTAALQQAFADILEKIEMAGITGVSIEDGTTEAVKIETTDTNGMLVVDSSSFEYTVTIPITDGKASIRGKEATLTGNTLTWEDKSVEGTVEGNNFIYKWTEANDLTGIAPPPATDNGGTVVWDLKDAGVLINGATYRVTFDVWPSQETYDLVADLKNGTKDYDGLDSSITQYLSRDYKLKTNTTAKIKYTDSRNNDGEKESEYVNPPDVGTATDTISIEKEFEAALDDLDQDVKSIKVGILRDDEVFYNTTLTSDTWKKEGINIATGLMRSKTKTVDGQEVTELEILDKGHDYKFAELDEEAYNWELETQTVHPMLINGTLTELILIDEVTQDEYTVPTAMDDKNVMTATGEDGNVYYRLEKGSSKVYVVGKTSPNVKAFNHRRSNLNIAKKVDGAAAPEDETFDITITLNDEGLTKNEKIWFSVWDSSIGENGGYADLDVEGWTKEIIDGEWTGFYSAPNNTPATLSLTQSQNVRFTNITDKASYTIVEADKAGYEFITAKKDITAIQGKDKVSFDPNATINTDTKTVTGKIERTNSKYTVNIVNQYQKTEFEVEKLWTNDIPDGIQPDSVKVQLYADGEESGNPVDVKKADNWKYKWEELDRFNDENKEIEYTVKEVESDFLKAHYTTEVNGNKITNTRIEEDKKTSLTVTKAWENDNTDGIQPDSVKVQLYADGEESGDPVEVKKVDNWTYTFSNLPKYSEGEEIKYTVKEIETDFLKAHYTTEVSGNTITNTRITEDKTTSLTVTKTWENDNTDGVQPDSVQVQLYADGETSGDPVDVKKVDNWTYTFSNLPKYSEGEEIKYTVKEVESDFLKLHYTTEVSGNKITNTRIEEDKTTSLTVKKAWTNDIPDGIQPDSVQVQLYADGETSGNPVEVKKSDNWEYTFSNLPKYSEGEEIKYTVKEVETDFLKLHYTTEVTGNTITNTRIEEDKTTSLTVTKAWENDNTDGIQPDSVQVQLYADGEESGDPVDVKKADNWTYTFSNLPKYSEGQEIEYTVKEVESDFLKLHYTTEVNGNIITNTRITEDKTTSLTVTKEWVGDVDDNVQPESVQVQLYADGEVSGNPVDVTKTGNWTYTFENLPKYSEGQEIKYTVKEVESDYLKLHYTTKVSGNTITNTRKTDDKTIDYTVYKFWTNDIPDGVQPTSVQVQLYADGEESGSPVDVTKEAGWEYTFEDLPKYNGGQEIEYTVKEVESDFLKLHYTTSVEDNKITNTRIEEDKTTSLTVTKVWKNDNTDGVQPDSVQVQLYADGETSGDPVDVKKVDNWTYTFSNLPKYSEGQEIEYTVKEVESDYLKLHYTTEVTGNTITNTRIEEDKTTSLTVTKTWENDNTDGVQPDSVQVQLYADGEESGSPVDVKKEENWTYTFENLPKYSEGQEISYTVKEVESDFLKLHYTTEVTGNTITNTRIEEDKTTSFTVTKAWTNDIPDGIQPESVQVQLYADGEESGSPVDVKKEENWTYTFSNLPKYSEGQEISYTVKEVESDFLKLHYTTEVTGNTITNTRIEEDKTTSLTVTKVWENDNNDGVQPTSVKVQLYADGETSGDPVDVTKEANWEYTFSNLPKYTAGQEISYTVEEVETDYLKLHYTTKVEGNTITNTRKTDDKTTSVSGTKTWDDNNNQDGKRKSITVNLYKTVNGTKTPVASKEVELSNKMSYSFDNLPKFEDGYEITYSIDEDALEGYTPTYDGYNILNSHTPEKTDLEIKKEWEDASNQDGIRPGTITVQLLENGTQIKELTLSAENGWTEKVTGLPVYKDGSPITYTVTETKVDGYEPAYDGLVITNTHKVDKTSVCVKKDWQDDGDRDGVRPDSITVELYQNGSATGRTFTLDAENNWQEEVTDLDKNSEGSEIKYSFVETEVPEGYEVTYSSEEGVNSGDFTVTNTHKIATTKVEGTKTWDDANNQDGKRPATVTIKLMKTVNEETSEVTSKTIKVADEMHYTFDNLPVNEKGTPITYSVEEEPVEGYEPEYNGYDIVNKHTPETTEVTVTKEWDNEENIYEFATPTSVTINLLNNGEKVDDTVLSEENGWTHTFTDLPKYSEGSEIPYTVEEVSAKELSDYSESTEGSIAEGFVITNTYVPSLIPEIIVTKTWDDNLDQDGLRPDTLNIRLVGRVNEDIVYTSETVELTGDKDVAQWTYTFTNIPEKYLGETINYTIEEELEDETYTGENTSALEITNTYAPQTVNYKIYKDWEDNEDQDGKRPTSITVYLYDGEELLQTIEMNEETGWYYEFNDLPKYKEHGTLIEYRIVEEEVKDYTSEVVEQTTETTEVVGETTEEIDVNTPEEETDSNEKEIRIINTHVPETITVTIEKTWDDEEDKNEYRPESIEVVILANDEEYRNVTLSEENDWKYTADDLPKYKDGEIITYTVKELAVEHYTTTYENAEYEFKITNKVIAPPEITPPNTFVEVIDNDSKEEYISLISLILILLSVISLKRVTE